MRLTVAIGIPVDECSLAVQNPVFYGDATAPTRQLFSRWLFNIQYFNPGS
jgi:hypothetical protein